MVKYVNMPVSKTLQRRKLVIPKSFIRPAVFTACVMVLTAVGVYFMLSTHAATSTISAEPENGQLASGAVKVADSAASAGHAVTFVRTAPTAPAKLMPLGDSITYGFSVSGGYRTLLWQKLVQTDKDNIDFVGLNNDGPPALGDKDHEGQSGWCIEYRVGCATLLSGIDTYMSQTKPDIILLHAGTNDLYNARSSGAQTAKYLDDLLNRIYIDKPSTTVIVSKLIFRADSNVAQAAATDYNNAIPGVVQKYQNQGRKIETVDMSKLLNYPADYADPVHPNQQGYDKMATAWYPAATAAYKALGY